MRQTVVLGTGIFIAIFTFAYIALLVPVSAHGDEDETSEAIATEASASDIKRMETLISVLQQLITVMTELRTQYPGMSFATPTTMTPAMPAHHEESSTPPEMDHHMESTTTEQDETSDVASTPSALKLLIEIEEHSGKTHAHVRYVDGRPEAMFFVDAPISNEDAVVSAISALTGLGTEEVKNALKYTGM